MESPATTTYALSLHDALPIYRGSDDSGAVNSEPSTVPDAVSSNSCRHCVFASPSISRPRSVRCWDRSEEHTSELQSRGHLVCRLLLEKKIRCKGDGSQTEVEA